MSAVAVDERLVAEFSSLARAYEESQAFLSLLAHELRSKLKVTERALASPTEDCLEAARENTRTVQDLVESLLELARSETTQTADAGAAAAAALHQLAAEIEQSGAEITVGRLPAVQLAPALLETILRNLVVNALEAGAARIEIFARGDGTIGVRDDGPGVRPSELDLIFGVYSGKAGGSGLGLALTREILHRRGGDIWLESPSTFAFHVG